MSTNRGANISKAKLGGREKSVLYNTIKTLAAQGCTVVDIAETIGVSYPSCINWAKEADDEELLALFAKNRRESKSRHGKLKKGLPSPLKGRTYVEIFGGVQAAKRRAAITSAWMRTDKNLRRYNKKRSDQQVEMADALRLKYPDIEMEAPITLKNGSAVWLDVAIPSVKLNIEIDGEYWHQLNAKQGKRPDVERDEALINLGWTIIRIPYKRKKAKC